MSSFGEGIRITPFQLASLVGMLANGARNCNTRERKPRARTLSLGFANGSISLRCFRTCERECSLPFFTGRPSAATTRMANRTLGRRVRATTKEWADASAGLFPTPTKRIRKS